MLAGRSREAAQSLPGGPEKLTHFLKNLCPTAPPGGYFLQMAFDYTSRKWKGKRLQILRRDKYQCQDCRRYGRMREATEVHHIKHADEYPELVWDSSNLVSLCHACHNARHPEKAKAARERRERK